MTADLFQDAQRDTTLRKVAATHGGEWAGACPFCGGKDRFHIQPAENRWLCRGCTDGKWQRPAEYYRRRGDIVPSSFVTRPKPERKQYSWLADPWPLIRQYEAHPRRFELWQRHKPLSRSTIERMHLGIGVLPVCSCHHERLIVPVLDGTMCVGLRGRRLSCNCPEKWHQAAGTTLDLLPLYNQAALRPGCVVGIVENCADALLATERGLFVGVATYSTSYWRDTWAQTLLEMCPELILVAYDNDLPGQGGGARRPQFEREWLKTHTRVPDPAGPRLANRLLEAGLPAILLDWDEIGAPAGADIGSLIMGAVSAGAA